MLVFEAQKLRVSEPPSKINSSERRACAGQWVRVPEVEFVNAVSAGGSVKFFASGVNFSIFTHCLCFFLLKLLKLGEIDGVKFLA